MTILYAKHNLRHCRRAYVYNVTERQAVRVVCQQGARIVASLDMPDYQQGKRAAYRFYAKGDRP